MNLGFFFFDWILVKIIGTDKYEIIFSLEQNRLIYAGGFLFESTVRLQTCTKVLRVSLCMMKLDETMKNGRI